MLAETHTINYECQEYIYIALHFLEAIWQNASTDLEIWSQVEIVLWEIYFKEIILKKYRMFIAALFIKVHIWNNLVT